MRNGTWNHFTSAGVLLGVRSSEPSFDMVGTQKCEDEAERAIDPKAPDFVMLRMELFRSE